VISLAGATRVCTLYGAGHIVTFDDAHFDYEGVCKYVVAAYFDAAYNFVFRITAGNQNRYGATDVSWLNYVEIYLANGFTWRIGPGYKVTVGKIIN
jgi:von Willebrand factor type D domain